jgi:hypothetical protein
VALTKWSCRGKTHTRGHPGAFWGGTENQLKKECAVRIKQIGIAVGVVAGALMAASPWTQVDRTGVFDQVAQHSRSDTGATDEDAGRFDPYTQGHLAGWASSYATGIGSPVIDLVWLQRNT